MEPLSHIPRSVLQEMFDRIRQHGKWNLDGDLLWGYFFFDDRPDRLEPVRAVLEARGYRFVDVFQTEGDDGPTGVFMLHVERVETHTVDSLDRRNGEFDALAAAHGLSGYDGMDVGPVDPKA
jgi:hypothetical protein